MRQRVRREKETDRQTETETERQRQTQRTNDIFIYSGNGISNTQNITCSQPGEQIVNNKI